MEESFVSGPEDLLAKPDLGLLDHIRQTIEAGRVIARLLKLDGRLLQKALFACALHDIGKATKSFQKYIRGETGSAFPHALAGFPLVYLLELELFGEPPEASLAVISHHTPIHSTLYDGYRTENPEFISNSDLSKLILKALSEIPMELENESLEQILEILPKKPPYDFWCHAKGKISGIKRMDFAGIKTVLQLADWAASGNYNSERYFLTNGRRDVDDSLKKKGIQLREFQKRCLKAGEQLFLRAPTGSGKTEALVSWASFSPRIIYLLPTRATSNAMYERMKNIFQNRVGLSHGKASFYMAYNEDDIEWDEHLLATSFAKPINIATIDQLLLAHLNGRHWEIKETMAREGAVVFDEIHSYEPYTLGILANALEHMQGCRKAFASATLPSPLLEFLRKTTGQDGELVEAEDDFWNKRRHRILLSDKPSEDIFQDVATLIQQDKKVLVVFNTVAEAQDFFKQISEVVDNNKCLLLHSRFIQRDRAKREKIAMNPPSGFVLVSTQIVEVSLDISYDALFTQLAPLDALVQRMGRVNRYGNMFAAPVVIFQESEKSKRVYDEKDLGILSKTREILNLMKTDTPSDREICLMVDELYGYLFSQKKFCDQIDEGKSVAERIRNDLGIYSLLLEETQEKKLTRSGALSIDIIPKRFSDEAHARLEEKQAWRLNEIMVPVPWWWIKDPIRLTPWAVIANIDYDDDLGVIEPTEPSEEFLYYD